MPTIHASRLEHVVARRPAERERARGVDDCGHRLVLRERLQPARHRAHGHERRRREDQRAPGSGTTPPGRSRRPERGGPRSRRATRASTRTRGPARSPASVDSNGVSVLPADGEADDAHQHHHEDVADQVGEGASDEHRRARHRQRAEPIDESLLQVLGEPDPGRERAEHHRLHEDARHEEVDVGRRPAC